MYERAKEARMSAPKLVTTVGGTKRGQEDADREAKRPRPEKEKSSEDQVGSPLMRTWQAILWPGCDALLLGMLCDQW
jgi:hypothetical protein